MGIRGLTSLIKKYVPNAIKMRPINYFKGSTIAIDTSILLYKFRYSNTNPNSHINGFLNKCLSYIKHGILPVFILDGKPPVEKNCIILKRSRHKQKIEKRILSIESSAESSIEDKELQIKKLKKQIINVSNEHHKDTKELLTSLGFCVINSPSEAETVCALLQKNGIVNFTYSDDTDALVLGCNKVLRSGANNVSLDEIDLDTILNGLGLSSSEFVDLCILCGCDYCSTIPKLNYTTAYELISKYKNIEEIIENVKGTYSIPVNFDYQRARVIFNSNEVSKDILSKDLSSKDLLKESSGLVIGRIENPIINEEKLTKFLSSKNYSYRYINEYIRRFSSSARMNLRKVNNNTCYFKI